MVLIPGRLAARESRALDMHGQQLTGRAFGTSAQPAVQECVEFRRGRVAPSDAEGVAGGVGIDLTALVGGEVAGLQEPRSGGHGSFMRRVGVCGVQVEVDLLRCTVGPLRRLVVRGELDSEPPLPIGVDDAVESVVIVDDVTVQERGPEGALSSDVSSIEDNHRSNKVHELDASVLEKARTGYTSKTPEVHTHLGDGPGRE